MEQGKADRSEAAIEAPGNLGDSNKAADVVQARELAMFNLAIDSKLRACDLTRLQVQDVYMGGHVLARATFMQQKTHRPVQFEITEQTRQSVSAWISARGLKPADHLFPSRLHASAHVSTRQYARIVHRWIASIGLDDTVYGTHTIATNESVVDLSTHQELASGSIAVGPYEN